MGQSTLVVVHRVTANIFKLLCLMLDAHVSEHPNRELAGPGYQEFFVSSLGNPNLASSALPFHYMSRNEACRGES